MSDHIVTSVVTVITALIGVAIIAVLVSGKANTSGVLSAGGSALSGVIGTAVSPVTGGGSLGGFNFTGGGAAPSITF